MRTNKSNVNLCVTNDNIYLAWSSGTNTDTSLCIGNADSTSSSKHMDAMLHTHIHGKFTTQLYLHSPHMEKFSDGSSVRQGSDSDDKFKVQHR